MEPIINPWVFYLIDGASTLKWGALIFGFVLGLVLLCFGAWSIDEACSREEEKSANENRINYLHHRYCAFLDRAIFGNGDEDGHS